MQYNPLKLEAAVQWRRALCVPWLHALIAWIFTSGFTSMPLSEPGNHNVDDSKTTNVASMRHVTRNISHGRDSLAVEPLEFTKVTVTTGDTLAALLSDRAKITPLEILKVTEALDDVLDPRDLRPGQDIAYALTTRAGENAARLDRLYITLNIDTRIIVERSKNNRITARTEAIPHQRAVKSSSFEIVNNLYSSAVVAGVPGDVLYTVYQQLSNRVDFQRDLRVGDHITTVFETFRHGDDGTVHAGALLATVIDQDDRRLAIYRFTTPDGSSAYYNAAGVSVETALLRTPVRLGRLSSLFGKRKHPILNYTRTHEGLDFAAPAGTPVLAAGDGLVVRADRYGSFGKYIRVRHGSRLATAYAHLSRYAEELNVGDTVRQGQVIGYVGSTGLASGPNLHYEVMRDDKPVDPRKLDLPPRRELEGETLDIFQNRMRQLDFAIQRSVEFGQVAHLVENRME